MISYVRFSSFEDGKVVERTQKKNILWVSVFFLWVELVLKISKPKKAPFWGKIFLFGKWKCAKKTAKKLFVG